MLREDEDEVTFGYVEFKDAAETFQIEMGR